MGKVSTNFEFIEGREARYKVVKFGGVRIADEEIVHYEGESSGVGVMAEEHGGGGFGVAVLGKGNRGKVRHTEHGRDRPTTDTRR